MKLKLENNLTKVVTILDNISEIGQMASNYVLSLALPEKMDEGEYNYTLLDDNDAVLASGLCVIGDYVPEETTYTAQTQTTYKQYEA